MKYVVYDLETRHLVGDPKGDGEQHSWKEVHDLGISVGCTWSKADGYKDWFEEDAIDLVKYMKPFDGIVTFNGCRFDNAVLLGACYKNASAKPPPADLLDYPPFKGKMVDLLLDIKDATGSFIGLDAVAQATLGHTKTDYGKEAPRKWGRYQRLEVIEYCRADVALTRDLFMHGLEHNAVDISRGGEGRSISIEWTLRDARGIGIEPVRMLEGGVA